MNINFLLTSHCTQSIVLSNSVITTINSSQHGNLQQTLSRARILNVLASPWYNIPISPAPILTTRSTNNILSNQDCSLQEKENICEKTRYFSNGSDEHASGNSKNPQSMQRPSILSRHLFFNKKSNYLHNTRLQQ
jgi:hypothetical protein